MYRKIIILIIFKAFLLSQECIDPYISGLDSCFNAGPSFFSATKTEVDISNIQNVRFEWNQCTDGGLFKIYIWEDENGLPGNDVFSQLQLTDNLAGWNHAIISTNNIPNELDLWVGIREYTATQAIGLDQDSNGCSAVYTDGVWAELEDGNLAYRITTCIEDNPAGCFQTGCSDNYVCLDDWENNCSASNCICDENFGNWGCTDDCNGGTCFLTGCLDPNACNYNSEAVISDNNCAYELDCAGVCGGNAIEDICGVCNGTTYLEEECAQYYCNLDLVSYLGFGQGLSDITGFFQDGREFAVVGLIQDAAVFVDITDPYLPIEIGRIEGTPSIWRDIKYWNRHVYIGTEAPDGVKVVSVNDPDNPIIVNTISDFTNSHNIHIDADGYLYVVGADSHDLWIYDLISDPANPNLIGTWDGEYFHDIEVFNNKLYGAAIYSGQVYILDVSDKANPQTILVHQTGGVMTHDCAVTYDENYLITADETSGGHIKIWDISDYQNINLLSEYLTHPDHSVHNVYVRPETDLVIISYYVDGTRVLNIEDPSNPIEVGYFDTSDWTGLFDGNWGVYAYLPSGYIISSDRANGLFIFGSPLTDLSMEWSDCSVQQGDINFDGGLNILDLVRMINYILEFIELTDIQVLLADMNEDGGVNVLDVTILSNLILEP